MIDLARWPALVLTAGLATRLRPLSCVRAKAALPVAGTPLVIRILRWLRAAGIRRVILNLHHLPETITGIVGDGSQVGLEVRYSWESVVLGSAGGPRRALPLLDAPHFFVVNGDTLTDCNLQGLAMQHVERAARVTMAVVEGDVQRYGGVLLGENSHVVGFGAPRPDTRARHFVGVQAVNADVFSGLADDKPHESVKTVYPQLITDAAGTVQAYESRAEFLDVGTPRDYFTTVETVAAREHRPLDLGIDCNIASDAIVEHSILWDRVAIGRRARLANCIVTDDVVIPHGAEYENVVISSSHGAISVSSVDRKLP